MIPYVSDFTSLSLRFPLVFNQKKTYLFFQSLLSSIHTVLCVDSDIGVEIKARGVTK